MLKIYTRKELMFVDIEATTDAEVISMLCDAAIEAGYAEPEFKPAVLDREKIEPTALNMHIPIAIPHVHTGCKNNFIAVASLKNPVNFGNMADLKNPISVQLVILVGLECLSVQSRVLRLLFNFVQIGGQVDCYLKDRDKEGMLESLQRNLTQYITIE